MVAATPEASRRPQKARADGLARMTAFGLPRRWRLLRRRSLVHPIAKSRSASGMPEMCEFMGLAEIAAKFVLQAVVTVETPADRLARAAGRASGEKLGQAADFAEGRMRLFHLTVAPKGSRLDHSICDRRRGNRHQNSHAQSRSVRTPDGRSQADQSRSVGSLDGKSCLGTRSSNIRQIRRKLRQAIPNPSPMDNTLHTRGNTLENNQDSLASERG